MVFELQEVIEKFEKEPGSIYHAVRTVDATPAEIRTTVKVLQEIKEATADWPWEWPDIYAKDLLELLERRQEQG